MNTNIVETLSPAEQAIFAAMVERLRQLRRRCGVPDAMTLNEAVAVCIISAVELEQARWGDLLPMKAQKST
jgi:hypothetical protein